MLLSSYGMLLLHARAVAPASIHCEIKDTKTQSPCSWYQECVFLRLISGRIHSANHTQDAAMSTHSSAKAVHTWPEESSERMSAPDTAQRVLAYTQLDKKTPRLRSIASGTKCYRVWDQTHSSSMHPESGEMVPNKPLEGDERSGREERARWCHMITRSVSVGGRIVWNLSMGGRITSVVSTRHRTQRA